jgi:hypothetical protein
MDGRILSWDYDAPDTAPTVWWEDQMGFNAVDVEPNRGLVRSVLLLLFSRIRHACRSCAFLPHVLVRWQVIAGSDGQFIVTFDDGAENYGAMVA